MVVRELIALLQTMPPDALVITDHCSDYEEIEADDIRVHNGRQDFETHGCGLIRHHGHLMDLRKQWLDANAYRNPEQYANPEFVTAICF